MVHLQRILLGPHLPIDENSHSQIEDIFNRVLFPLLDELLKPQTLMRDPLGLPETRLRASALLCKAFMQFEAREGQTADIRVLWIQVLDLLDRLMHVDRRDQLVRLTSRFFTGMVLTLPITVRGRTRVSEERPSRDERDWAARPARLA